MKSAAKPAETPWGILTDLDRQDFDEHFVNRLRRRDPAAEREFFAHFSAVIKIKLRATNGPSEWADDIRQETLFRVLRRVQSGPELDHPDRLAAFVHAVCANVTKEIQRERNIHPELHKNAPDPVDLCPDPYEGLATSERVALVREVMSQLRPKDRTVLRLVYLDEVGRKEACRQLNIGPGNLRVALHRARLQFKRILERRKDQS